MQSTTTRAGKTNVRVDREKNGEAQHIAAFQSDSSSSPFMGLFSKQQISVADDGYDVWVVVGVVSRYVK